MSTNQPQLEPEDHDSEAYGSSHEQHVPGAWFEAIHDDEDEEDEEDGDYVEDGEDDDGEEYTGMCVLLPAAAVSRCRC